MLGCLQRQGAHSFCRSGLILLLLAPALKVSTSVSNPRLTLQLRETQGSSIEGLHPLTLGGDVPLQQSMLLQQVRGLHQVLPTLPGQQLSLQDGAAQSTALGLALKSFPRPDSSCQPSAPIHHHLNSELGLSLRVSAIICLSLNIPSLIVSTLLGSGSIMAPLSMPPYLSIPISFSLCFSLYLSLCFHPFLHLCVCLSTYVSIHLSASGQSLFLR